MLISAEVSILGYFGGASLLTILCFAGHNDAECLRGVVLEDVVDLFKRCIRPSPTRSRLSVSMRSAKVASAPTVTTDGAPTAEDQDDGLQNQLSAATIIEDVQTFRAGLLLSKAPISVFQSRRDIK